MLHHRRRKQWNGDTGRRSAASLNVGQVARVAPRISVVIATHDNGATLADALASLQAQTRRDWEALVVDDGSTDTTRETVASVARTDPRIRMLDAAPPGLPDGLSRARNLGLAAARGCFVLFLGADGWLAPTALRKLAVTLESHRGSAVHCAQRRIAADGSMGPPVWNGAIAGASRANFARSFESAMSAVMLERATVQKLGGFDEDLANYADWDLLQRLARTGAQFVALPLPLAGKRLPQASASRDARAMLSDARLVIERGFDPDGRVAATIHARGTRQRGSLSRVMALGLSALWCAAAEAGQGRDGCDLLLPLPDRREWLVEACRGVILDGLSFGAGCLPSDLAHDASRHGPSVRRLCETLAALSGRPALAEKLQYALGPEIHGPAAEDRRQVGSTLLVRQDLARLEAVKANSSVTSICLEVRNDSRVLARFAMSAAEAHSRAAVVEAVIRAIGLRAYIEANTLRTSLRFWIDGVGETLSCLLDDKRRTARETARAALGRAAARHAARQPMAPLGA